MNAEERHAQDQVGTGQGLGGNGPASSPPGESGAPAEQRHGTRVPMHKPFTMVPLLPDGSPDWEQRAPATSRDLSASGIGLEFETPMELSSSSVVLLSQDAPGLPGAAGVEVCYQRHGVPDHLLLGGRFGGIGQDILEPANLTPVFRQESMEFALNLPEPVLRRWEEVGVLERRVVDRVLLCPRCQGLPTFRRGCRHCGSAFVTNDRLIHHFACAHVGFVGDFEVDGALVCPKCRTRQLVVGADFEHLTGPHRCLECQWSDTELEAVAQCLRCNLRFPGYQAHEQELRGYHVHRLDPLALLAAPQ